ncbi:hypothetical protein D3C72_1885610 [compost metagenome]
MPVDHAHIAEVQDVGVEPDRARDAVIPDAGDCGNRIEVFLADPEGRLDRRPMIGDHFVRIRQILAPRVRLERIVQPLGCLVEEQLSI